MGFVPSSSTIQLYAYFTEYARERIFNGDVPDFQVTQFSLHDEDINYQISKINLGQDSSGNTIYNIPKSGFIPDITGDIDSCIKSNKNTIVFGRNMLTGTTQISTPVVFGCTNPLATNYNASATVDDGSCQYPPTPIRTLKIGFQDSTNTPIDNYGTSTFNNKKNFSYNLNVNLTQNIGESNPTLQEITSSSFIVELAEEPLSPVVLNGSIKVNNVVLPATVNFTNNSNLMITLSFNRNSNYNPNPPEIEYTEIKIKLTSTNPNRPIDTAKSTFIYRANIYAS